MSELKVRRHIDEDTGIVFSFYGKSEADKVIAYLKNEIEKQKRLRDMALASVPNVLKVMKIIQHHKYKRCLAMTMWCKSKSEIYNEFAADVSEYMPSYVARFRSKAVLYQKWAMRWLELAAKFKEAK